MLHELLQVMSNWTVLILSFDEKLDMVKNDPDGAGF